MVYDALTESLQLIETGRLVPRTSLSRRCRHLAMAVDVAGDYAVTMFARRSVGRTVTDSWLLARRDGSWSLLWGSTEDADANSLQHRPARLDTGLPPGLRFSPHVATSTTGGVKDSRAKSVLRPRGRWVYSSSVQVSADVASVSIGSREVMVPWHGKVAVVWTGRRRRIEVRAEDGTLLDQDRLSTMR